MFTQVEHRLHLKYMQMLNSYTNIYCSYKYIISRMTQMAKSTVKTLGNKQYCSDCWSQAIGCVSVFHYAEIRAPSNRSFAEALRRRGEVLGMPRPPTCLTKPITTSSPPHVRARRLILEICSRYRPPSLINFTESSRWETKY